MAEEVDVVGAAGSMAGATRWTLAGWNCRAMTASLLPVGKVMDGECVWSQQSHTSTTPSDRPRQTTAGRLGDQRAALYDACA